MKKPLKSVESPIEMAAADLDATDVEGVAQVVRSGRLALGPKTLEFEKQMADYIGVRHAIAVNSGTAALHLIVRAMGLGAGDEVLVPSFTFAASVNAILYEGARPVFVDINPTDFNLDPDDVERKITRNTKAIMAVDVFGHPVDWDRLIALSKRHGLRIIDDSCEALGAEYRGAKTGTFGDAATFAFYPNKQITTGEGGMVVTNDDEIARLCRSNRNQGRDEMGQWLQHERLGFNYRMDEMSAALGVSQLRRIEKFLELRDSVAASYTRRLSRFDWVRPPVVAPHVRMSWFVYVVTLSEGLDRDAVIKELARQGVPARGYFSLVHEQTYLKAYPGSAPGPKGLPISESIARRTLALPFHNHLTEAEIDRVVTALEVAVKASRREEAA